jgi:hypothetical protein
VLVDGFLHVSAATEKQFRVSVLVPASFLAGLANPAGGSMTPEQIRQALSDALEAPAATNTNQWRVEWIGVEG